MNTEKTNIVDDSDVDEDEWVTISRKEPSPEKFQGEFTKWNTNDSSTSSSSASSMITPIEVEHDYLDEVYRSLDPIDFNTISDINEESPLRTTTANQSSNQSGNADVSKMSPGPGKNTGDNSTIKNKGSNVDSKSQSHSTPSRRKSSHTASNGDSGDGALWFTFNVGVAAVGMVGIVSLLALAFMRSPSSSTSSKT